MSRPIIEVLLFKLVKEGKKRWTYKVFVDLVKAFDNRAWNIMFTIIKSTGYF